MPVVRYKVWAHIEGVDEDGDCIRGDEYFEPHLLGEFDTPDEARDFQDKLAMACTSDSFEDQSKVASDLFRMVMSPEFMAGAEPGVHDEVVLEQPVSDVVRALCSCNGCGKPLGRGERMICKHCGEKLDEL
jgi:hypothetical protein